MNRLSFLYLSLLFGLGLTLSSCWELEPTDISDHLVLNLPDEVYDYESAKLPDEVLQNNSLISSVFGTDIIIDQSSFFDNNFFGNANPEVTNDGATLGRVLFYDKQLSRNNSVACASCHHQAYGFAEPFQFSEGFEGKITSRNSMAIINPVLNRNLFWDSRVNSAKQLALRPVENHIEMGIEEFDLLEKKIKAISYYPVLFKKAFGDEFVSSDRIADAIAQFLLSMTTANAKFDKAQEDFNSLEKLGMDLFFDKANCSSCHAGFNFSAPDSFGGEYQQSSGTANIGLDVNYEDNGRGQGKFRIPSLRNIALTAPYMHDGRFSTLEEVIDHYSEGIQDHPHLDKKFKAANGQAKPLHLTTIEKKALLAFLHTLTDETFVNDPKYASPFK